MEITIVPVLRLYVDKNYPKVEKVDAIEVEESKNAGGKTLAKTVISDYLHMHELEDEVMYLFSYDEDCYLRNICLLAKRENCNANPAMIMPHGLAAALFLTGAERYVLVYNHPGVKNIEPSELEKEYMENQDKFAEIMDMTLQDVIIVGEEDMYYMKDGDRFKII